MSHRLLLSVGSFGWWSMDAVVTWIDKFWLDCIFSCFLSMHFTLGQGTLDKLIQDSDTNPQLLNTVHPAAKNFLLTLPNLKKSLRFFPESNCDCLVPCSSCLLFLSSLHMCSSWRLLAGLGLLETLQNTDVLI